MSVPRDTIVDIRREEQVAAAVGGGRHVADGPSEQHEPRIREAFMRNAYDLGLGGGYAEGFFVVPTG